MPTNGLFSFDLEDSRLRHRPSLLRNIAGKRSEHFRPRSPRPCLDITQWPLTIISLFLATRVLRTSSVMTFPKLSGRSCPRYYWVPLGVLFMHWMHLEWWPTSRALHVMESTTWTMGCSKCPGNVCAVQRCHGFRQSL